MGERDQPIHRSFWRSIPFEIRNGDWSQLRCWRWLGRLMRLLEAPIVFAFSEYLACWCKVQVNWLSKVVDHD